VTAAAASRYEAVVEENTHNWFKRVPDIDHADGTKSHDIPSWMRRAETGGL
jgi:hypothetical protein